MRLDPQERQVLLDPQEQQEQQEQQVLLALLALLDQRELLDPQE